MHISYHRRPSAELGRDMEYKRYGQAGRPVVVFPTSNGRFFQFEDSGAVAALAEFIDAGQIQLFTLDSIDGETFFGKDTDRRARIERHEAYFRYVRGEALPEIMELSRPADGGARKPIFAGCSMGAFHAANFVFRFPTLVAGLIALSGVYSVRDFFGDAREGQLYFNSPLDYLPGLEDAASLAALRRDRLIFCCGQGRWEERMLEETRLLEGILRSKEIPSWVDYWGADADHDWPWWHRQLDYFMRQWLDEDGRHRLP